MIEQMKDDGAKCLEIADKIWALTERYYLNDNFQIYEMLLKIII